MKRPVDLSKIPVPTLLKVSGLARESICSQMYLVVDSSVVWWSLAHGIQGRRWSSRESQIAL